MTRALLLLFLLLVPALGPAHAEGPGLSLGLRTGYGIPFGTFRGTPDPDRTDEVYSGLLPLGVDAALRFRSGFFVGGHAQYAFALLRDPGCFPELSCGGGNLRLGLDVGWRFGSRFNWSPWFALGAEYEWTDYAYAIDGGTRSVRMRYRGFNFLHAQAGVEHPLFDSALRVGPFVALSVGEYSHLDVTVRRGGNLRDITASEGVPREAAHLWFTFGLRGQLDFGER